MKKTEELLNAEGLDNKIIETLEDYLDDDYFSGEDMHPRWMVY